MERATQSPAQTLSGVDPAQNESGFFSSESVLSILKLIFSGSPLAEVLTIIARLVESQSEGMLCTIWLPDEDGKHLHCAAAPSLPGFSARVGRMEVCPKGASCGTAVYRREPVYVTDILTESIWDDYRDLVLPYGIRSVWSRPLFTSEGTVLGTFAILYRESRSPNTADLQLVENASYVTGIAIERHRNEQALQRERDRLRLLLEISSSVTSRLDLPASRRGAYYEPFQRNAMRRVRLCCYSTARPARCASIPCTIPTREDHSARDRWCR